MRTECIHCGGSLRNSDTDGQHADARTCVGRIAKILKSKDDHIAVQGQEIRTMRLERLALVPLLTEGRRIASENYCGVTLLDSALRCGMRKGHDARTHHKASVDMLGVIVVEAANVLGIHGVCGKDVTPGGRTCVNPPDHAGPCVGC